MTWQRPGILKNPATSITRFLLDYDTTEPSEDHLALLNKAMSGWQPADGYISEDSSFFGDDDTCGELQETAADFCKEDFQRLWRYCAGSINTLAYKLSRNPSLKEEHHDKIELCNPYEGQDDAWQLEESVDDFLKRLPPLEYRSNHTPWIWIANPYAGGESEDQADLSKFIKHGLKTLEDFDDQKRKLLDKHPELKPAAITRKMGASRDKLKQDILSLATECKVTSGKVSY